MTRLVLGTAQFGDAYGVTNAVGRLADSVVAQVVEAARTAGIDTFDTAADYGDSQLRLGRLGQPGARYVTKFSLPEPGVQVTPQRLFGQSMMDLGVRVLAGVMFHRMSDLGDDRRDTAIAILREARERGDIQRVGVSVYDIDDLEHALEVFPDLDLVQFPANIVDGRLLDHPLVARMHERGVELHVRSAFLQGLLLTPSSALPPQFAALAPATTELARRAASSGETVLGLLVRYLRDLAVVDGVVVGAVAPGELAAIVREWELRGTPVGALGDGVPANLLDPRHWDRNR